MTALTLNLSNSLNAVGLQGQVLGLERLRGGANKESWRFTLESQSSAQHLVLRRALRRTQSGSDTVGENNVAANNVAASKEAASKEASNKEASNNNMVGQFGHTNLHTEAELLRRLAGKGLQIPSVIAEFDADSSIGSAYVMSCEQGESLPERILQSAELAAAREQLAPQLGQQLAVLHKLDPDDYRDLLSQHSIENRINQLEQAGERLGNTSPVHALAFEYLRANLPASAKPCLVHGDFRLGNILVKPSGLSSILDWELSRISSAEEDLGYLTANAWRFGRPANPVGGFASYEQLLDAYEASAGWRPTLETLLFWQLFTAVNWGTICLAMHAMYVRGEDRSLERLAVGRRFPESEIDILLLLDEFS